MCPIQKCGFWVLNKTAQGLAASRTPVRHSRKPAEKAEQGPKDHFWSGTTYRRPYLEIRRER